ncbi:magnesium/cobalt transporter CorA [Viridibacillus sp. FSL R5-0477]|uniref:Magnesium transport protein CorA n=1 Tax=Viridibacillus arenosi FSL R5-213 TaxID=1227360 RepID=W4F949_9BACL|nr:MULTISPECIES: magnesium/cobalt transporter CorA [Viridibacillus]ETT88636.1 magnesium and cobalt transport protein CorA [Viridibacillus arenosi FSL R5-213]OMC81186.1 magnesium and cobalt transport protein CorA [Viridibacillus sp. FSL H8-0123]OMC85061.1 magnesium and cobalt transport protein CorA [Viridibacillus sp. FSL H7-0596]OMC90248.1 magnesium and cobalt transport protein CorA [Viridibacillus arenosi]
MIRTLGITNNQELKINFPLEELRNNPFEWYWVDFDEPTVEEELLLDTFFHFHPLAIEDCLMRLQRPKLDYYDDYQFLVAHKLNEETFEAEEVNMFVSEKFIVTFHKSPVPEFDIVRSRIHDQPQYWESGAIFVAYQAIDKIVDSYFPMVYNIEDHLNTIEDELNYQSNTKSMRYVFDLRSDLLHIRRTILPMRDLLYRILNSERFTLIKSERAYFVDIHDHLIKLTEMVESNRELTADMRDSHMSMNASRMNGIMMILTIISSIFIPLTFIAGVYGMNFENMPELHWHYSYFIVLAIMLIIAISMLVWFKYKGWFDLFKP